jgi:glucose dehydrogenase
MRSVGFILSTALIAGVALVTLTGQSNQGAGSAGPAKPYTTWRQYGGGAHSAQYTALDQINKANVAKLDVAWTFPVDGTVIFNPLVVDNVMYTQAGGGRIVALDAATGKELWSQTLKGALGARGMNYWESADRSDRRLIFLNAGHVTALNAQTGEVITSFGDNGRVDLRLGLAERGKGLNPVQTSNPGRIFENLYIIALPAQGAQYDASPGDVHAYDVRTGKLAWVFHAIPHPGEFGYDTWPAESYRTKGGVHNWSELTVDEQNGIAFIPFGSPRFDFYGGDRRGDNLFGNSLVALDARTGRRIWHYQIIHHDLWDWDLPQAPKLLTIQQNGKPVDVVAQASKHGFLFVFERRTGRPIWPIEERPVPQSDVPGEWSSPTQPFPTRPAPFARQTFTEKDINPFLPQAEQQAIRERMKYMRNEGLFTPPSFEGSIQMPGHNGGANFGTSAVDPLRGEFYVVSKALPTVVRIALPGEGGRGGGALGGGPTGPTITPAQKAEMIAKAKELVSQAGPQGARLPSPYEFMNTYSFGAAAIGPPWSRMTKYDLNTGEIVWQIPTGSVSAPPEMKMPNNTGAVYPRNGPLVTAGGLVFLATGPERKVRAYDRDTGKELWVRDLPLGSEGMPASYEVDGRQFVVFPVATAGGSFAANYNQPPRGAGPGPGAAAPAAAPRGAGAGRAGAAAGPPEAAAAQDAGRGGRGGRGGGRGGAQDSEGQYIAFALPR